MSRIDDIKKRHNLRKRQPSNSKRHPTSYHEYPQQSRDPSTSSSGHPLFNGNLFIMKCFLAAIIVLVGAILYKTDLLNTYPSAKSIVKNSLSKEMNFTMISGWYEKTFGEPLAFLPTSKDKAETASKDNKTKQFAVPVMGTVTEQFSEAKKGITYKTASNAEVDAINSGLVLSIENKKDIGKTVIVQHENGEESWYGKLKDVDVKQYDTVKQGQKIGTVTPDKNGKDGTFYFALKDGEKFVDPIQVIAH